MKHLRGGAREKQESSKLCIRVLNSAVPLCEAVCQRVSKCFMAWLLMISDTRECKYGANEAERNEPRIPGLERTH